MNKKVIIIYDKTLEELEDILITAYNIYSNYNGDIPNWLIKKRNKIKEYIFSACMELSDNINLDSFNSNQKECFIDIFDTTFINTLRQYLNEINDLSNEDINIFLNIIRDDIWRVKNNIPILEK